MINAQDPGGTTQDLLALGRSHPAEENIDAEATEETSRRFARRCLTTGIGIGGAASLLLLGFAATDTGRDVIQAAPEARFFIAMAVTALGGLCAGLICVGGIDRSMRPVRALQRQLTLEVRANRRSLGCVEHAIDRIAEQLPHDQGIRHWRGFNAAIKEGFGDQQTGTDGANSQASFRHLGLVRHDDGSSN